MSETLIPDLAVVRASLQALGFHGDDAITRFQLQFELAPTGDLDRETCRRIVEAHEANQIGKRHGHHERCYAVKGTISSSSGDPAPKLDVQLVLQSLDEETPVGTAKTDDKGRYEISYERERSKCKTAVFVKVLDGRATVAQSSRHFDAPPLLQIDLTVDESHIHGPSEYERILADVRVCTGSKPLQELTQANVDFLVGSTGWPTAKLAYLVVAWRLSATSTIDAAFFYALLRQGTLLGTSVSHLTVRNSVDLSTAIQPLYYDIVLLDAARIRGAVSDAIAQHVVPAQVAEKLDATLATLAKSTAAAQAYYQNDHQQQILATLAANVSAGKHTEVLNVLNTHGFGNLLQLYKELNAIQFVTPSASANSSGGSTSVASAMASALASNPQLVEDLKTLANAGKGRSSTAAEFDASTLQATPAEAGRSEQRFPTASFVANLATAGDAATIPDRAAMLKLLQANPKFDLLTGNVDQLLQRRPPSADTSTLRDALKATQRIFRLAPNYRQTSALLGAGIHSAAQIAAMGRTQFVKRVSADGAFTPDQAGTVFDKASAAHVATGMLAGELRAIGSAATIGAMSTPAVAERLQSVSQAFPNLKTLFYLTDQCECLECNSVLGAAAYLVDVLQFLKNRTVVDTTGANPNPNAKGVLFARRPDLGDIDLTCDNTNVPLPYIDIVCELLEEAVAPDPGFAYNGAVTVGAAPAALIAALQSQGLPYTNTAYVQGTLLQSGSTTPLYVRDEKVVCKLTPGSAANSWTVRQLRQTFRTAEELAAAPEYVNDAAYSTLQSSKIAFALPFDLFHEEARSYFTQFDVPRDQLMSALATGGTPAPRDIAADALDISDAERAIIGNTNDVANQSVYWNSGANDPATQFAVVDAFLTRTGLTYAELQDLLGRDFINHGQNLFIQYYDPNDPNHQKPLALCDTTKQIIAGLDDAALDHIHRFLRLRKRLGWSMDTLDHAIVAKRLGAGEITDDPFLVRIADLVRLQQRLKLSFDELIIYYGEIPREGNPSRYAQIFLNESANGTIDPKLSEDYVDKNPTTTMTKLSDVAATLSLVLGVKLDELNQLIAALGVNALLSFENLAALYSQVSLARSLALGISDFVILISLTGIDPLASPSDTLTFVAKVDRVRSAGLKPADLQFLLSFVASDLVARTLKDATITTLLTGIQTALQAAFELDRTPFDATLTADENQDSLRTVVGRLANVTPAQLSTLIAIADNSYAGSPAAPAFLDALLATPFGIDTTAIKAKQATLAATPSSPPAPFEAARQALIQQILADVSAYLYQQARESAVVGGITASLHLDATLARILLHNATLKTTSGPIRALSDILGDDALIDTTHSPNQPPSPPTITPAAFPDQYAATRLTQQMAQLLATTPLGNADVQWLFDHAAQLGWLQLDQLPFQSAMTAIPFGAWDQLQDAIGLFQRYPAVVNPNDPSAPFTMRDTIALVLVGTTTAASLLDQLALITGWDRAVLGDLDALFKLSTPDLSQYKLPATYLELERAVVLLRRLGLGVAVGQTLIKPQLGAADALTLRQALRTRYSSADWFGVLKQIYDPLRQQKRDALVAYLLATNPSFTTSDDLFDYFLVDVEMCSCQPTSRVVSAHGTLQLFAQRCLLGVEPTAVADKSVDDGWNQWSWMSAFRVWQANREVFLYPENWIDPALRDDKSELFVDFENNVRQNSLTDDSLTNATNGYLEALDNIAFLEVMATYYELRTSTLHVFARTKGGDGPVYYYRRFVKESSWTPWQKVDLDIKSNHLFAFTRNGRLNLAWPIFTAQPDQQQDIVLPAPPQKDTPETSTRTNKSWKIQMSVSELTSEGKWTPSKTSQDWITVPEQPTPYLDFMFPQENFRFIPMDLHGAKGFSLGVTTTDGEDMNPDSYVGGFTLTGCKGYPELLTDFQAGDLTIFPQFAGAPTVYQRYFGQADLSGSPPQGLQIFTALEQQLVQILGKVPDYYRVSWALQIGQIDFALWLLIFLGKLFGVGGIFGSDQQLPSQSLALGTFMPYFFEDGSHNYAVVPAVYIGTGNIDDGPGQIERFTYHDAQALFREFMDVLTMVLSNFSGNWMNDPKFIQLQHDVTAVANGTYVIEFHNFYHPLVCPLRKILYTDGIDKLMARDTQLTQSGFSFQTNYVPQSIVPPLPYGDSNASLPVEDIDFSSAGGYADYNWELFFHVPFSIAVRLTQDQQFEKAAQWFHYIFNPMDASSQSPPQKYWQTKPFFQTTHDDYLHERIDQIINGLAQAPTDNLSDYARAVADWRANPFNPFLIARGRKVAFQQAVLMKYLDNLIAWGDSLFKQDTMESVNQATQMYVLADKLLGPKPRIVPPVATPQPETYDQLEARVDLFSNALVDLENLIPNIALYPPNSDGPPPLTLSSLYFCVPPNSKLLGYWDTIADRLFKIRHCQDINGVERTLALFAPPIDPGALIAARAQGLSFSDVLAGLNAPLPFYRFSTLLQKTNDLTQQVVRLGSEILQALEKRDAEAFQRLRATEEIALYNAQRQTKLQQVADAQQELEVLQRSIDVTTFKSQYYHSRPFMNDQESLAMQLNALAQLINAIAIPMDIGAALAHFVPSFSIGIAGFGGSPTFSIGFGGENIAGSLSGFAGITRALAGLSQQGAGMASTLGSYLRRQDDWNFQATTADKELLQLQAQLAQANLKLSVAQADLAAHDVQIANAAETDQFLRSKFTNRELYEYLLGQLSSVYFSSYQAALNMAHKAERCFQHELGSTQTFIGYQYWDNLKQGLLAGDRLLADVRQMDVAYVELNKREYEVTKHVSLAQLDPWALLQLKTNGKCLFSIPEAAFDLDHPGHYFRRLKSAAMTIPCVAGPYASVSCKLSLVGNRYRKNTAPESGYAEAPGNDDRFVYNVGSIQSIATSQGQNDGGLFEVNFRDERYLPFEGQGAIGSWLLELPQTFRQFDYGTITDVILHLRYTARDGGSNFRNTVEGQLAAALQAMVVDAQQTGLLQSIDFGRELPDQLFQLQQSGSTTVTLSSDRLPLFTRGHAPQITSAKWIAVVAGNPGSYAMSVASPTGQPAQSFSLAADPTLKNTSSADSPSLTFDTAFTLAATNPATLQQLVLLIQYKLS